MHSATRSRPLIWIATFAWLAQLCLPVAHASVTAQTGAGIGAWCGARTTGQMTQKLAQLPDEIREILEQGSVQTDANQDCVQFCSGGAAGDLPRTQVTVLLRAAGLEKLLPTPLDYPRTLGSPTPPVRGPPLIS